MAAGVTGNDHDYATTLAAERGVNQRFRRELELKKQRSRQVAASVGTARNSAWTSTASATRASPDAQSSIVGRVGFEQDDPYLGRGFYVSGGQVGGDWDAAGTAILVVAWAAPVAKLFFDGTDADDDSAKLVRGRRTFVTTSAGDLRHYEDDLEPGSPPPRVVFPLPQQGGIAVPAPPKPVVRPKPATTQTTSAPPSTTKPAPRPKAAARGRSGPKAPPSLRARGAVKAAVESPRDGSLGSVLATLQPDQYELVTWPHDEALIVQGQPGTGKTIVATHRAAYLTHPDRKPHPLGRVALVGPTDPWAAHVRPSLARLEARDVPVYSLPALFAQVAEVELDGMVEGRDDKSDTSWKLGRFVDDALRSLKTARRQVTRTRDAVNLLCDPDVIELTKVRRRHPDEARWFLDSGGWGKLTSHRRYLPALAAVGQRLGRWPHIPFDHLVVDEAQDVRPLEWKLLVGMLRRPDAITLVGDVNQRRRDWTRDSWEELAVDLEITDDDGNAPVRHVTTGYRSTRRILRFANQLLPRNARGVDALRDGDDPVVEKVRPADVPQRATAAASTLAARHDPGFVAVISIYTTPIERALRSQGWARSPQLREVWRQQGRTILVLSPERARGLEFDAVVVVEPANFPQHFGRAGTLYTSLTRATKDLRIIHSSALPAALRKLARPPGGVGAAITG